METRKNRLSRRNKGQFKVRAILLNKMPVRLGQGRRAKRRDTNAM